MALLLAGWADVAVAKTFKVNNRRDKRDKVPGDGRCDADLDKPGKQCTLRAASQEANSDPDSYDIIKVPKGLYKLTIPSTDCGEGEACGDIDLKDKVSLYGAGPFKTVVDARKAKDRGLDVDTSQCKDPPKRFKAPFGKFCVLRGIGVKNGHPTVDGDCGSFNQPSCPDGGGFRIFGDSLSITQIAAWHNKARDGGGIIADGTFYQFNHITANHNTATVNGGGMYLGGTTAHGLDQGAGEPRPGHGR